MSTFSLSQDDNFQNMSFGTWGFRRITSASSPVVGEVYRAVQALEDSVVTVNNDLGDDLTAQAIPAGTILFGQFTSVTCSSGTVLSYKARP